jgi:hypothetical protein
MGLCQDPRLTYLNDKGFNVVKLPRAGIVPLGVIGRDSKSKEWLGTLDQIWKSDEPVPHPSEPKAAAGLTGQKTSDIKLSLGLEILANALSGMFGSTAPRLDAAYKNAKSVQFTFRDVVAIGIDPFAIGNFLAKGDLADANPFVKRFFGGQKNIEALVITEVLQSKSLAVTAKKDANTTVGVDVPFIQAQVGAKLKVESTNASNSEIVYQGPMLLTFGFKVFGIGMKDGEWQVYGVNPDAGLAFAAGANDGGAIVEAGELVELNFPAEAGNP